MTDDEGLVSSPRMGRVNRTVQPPASFESIQARPPYSSTIRLTMARPIPLPFPLSGWSRTNGSKTRSRQPDIPGLPGHLSFLEQHQHPERVTLREQRDR